MACDVIQKQSTFFFIIANWMDIGYHASSKLYAPFALLAHECVIRYSGVLPNLQKMVRGYVTYT